MRLSPLLAALWLVACAQQGVRDMPSPNDQDGSAGADARGQSPGDAQPGDAPPADGALAGPDAGEPVGGVDRANVFFVGHSLINFNMPSMLAGIAASAGVSHAYAAQITIGGNLKWNWEHAAEAQGSNARVELPTGRFDVLVMTEAIPLDNHIMWSQPEVYGGNFYGLAVGGNPAARVFLYETWHSRNEANWRGRIDTDRVKWARIADQIAARNPGGPPVLLVPGGRALGALVDAIAAGTVPGLSAATDVFRDDIHMNELGNYFIACVQYATIYRRSPLGLTHQTSDMWGVPYRAPNPDTARRMQEIAWAVVSTDDRAGLAR